MKNSKEQCVERVVDGTAGEVPPEPADVPARRLTEEEARRYQQLRRQGMKSELARREVLGKGGER